MDSLSIPPQAVANVTAAFEDESNTKLQQATLDSAINAIGFEDSGEDKIDPVKKCTHTPHTHTPHHNTHIHTY